MSWVLPVMSLVGTGLQAFGQYQQGKQQKQAYDYNAAVIEQEGAVKEYQIGKEETIMGGSQRAAYAKAGVMLKGSALDVMLESATNYEFDKLNLKFSTESQALQARYAGITAQNKATFGAGMTLLGGVLKIGDYAKIPTHTTTTTDSTITPYMPSPTNVYNQ